MKNAENGLLSRREWLVQRPEAKEQDVFVI